MSTITIAKRVTFQGDKHRLQVWVQATSNNIPATLFVYQRIPSVPLNTAPRDRFVHIASYADMGEFPENDPVPESPFFRRNGADLGFVSLVYLEETYQRMVLMFRQLVEDIGRLNDWPPVSIEEVAL